MQRIITYSRTLIISSLGATSQLSFSGTHHNVGVLNDSVDIGVTEYVTLCFTGLLCHVMSYGM